VFSTPVPDITNLKARITHAFCYNNWRHVGEHVERTLVTQSNSCTIHTLKHNHFNI
jgi:hypothetical protein